MKRTNDDIVLAFVVALIVCSPLIFMGCINPSFGRERIIICGNDNCPICAGYFDKGRK